MRAAPGIIILQHQKTRKLNHQCRAALGRQPTFAKELCKKAQCSTRATGRKHLHQNSTKESPMQNSLLVGVTVSPHSGPKTGHLKLTPKKKKEPKRKREKKDQQLEQEFLENRNVISTYMKKKDYSRAAAARYKETRRRRRNLKPTRDGYGSQLLLQHTSATTCALCTELSVTELYTRPSSWCVVSQSAQGSLCLPWKEALGTFCCISLLPKGKAAL